MINARINTAKDLEGHPVVLACFDLTEAEAAAAAHVVAAVRAERYRTAELSADDVLEMRELTALRHALELFIEGRDEADWLREEDREPLAIVRSLLWPIADLCEDALRAA